MEPFRSSSNLRNSTSPRPSYASIASPSPRPRPRSTAVLVNSHSKHLLFDQENSPALSSPSSHRSRSMSLSPLTSIENLQTTPHRPQRTPPSLIKVEEDDVLVMDGILVQSPSTSPLATPNSRIRPAATVARSPSLDSGASSPGATPRFQIAHKEDLQQNTQYIIKSKPELTPDRPIFLPQGAFSPGATSKCQIGHKEDLKPNTQCIIKGKPEPTQDRLPISQPQGAFSPGADRKSQITHKEDLKANTQYIIKSKLESTQDRRPIFQPQGASSPGATTKCQKMKRPDQSFAKTIYAPLEHTDWSPEDDGIDLQSFSSLSREDVDAYINSILYGSHKLPVVF